jgi:hypothetical protein
VLAATPFGRIVLLYGPLLLIGFAAGAIRTAAQRPGLTPRRRRALHALWVLVLLVGVPLWLVLAAVLHIW